MNKEMSHLGNKLTNNVFSLGIKKHYGKIRAPVSHTQSLYTPSVTL
jgi:hypothetical protein